MTVYLTKTMMSKLNKITYPGTSTVDTEINNDHWEKLIMDRYIHGFIYE